MSVDQPRRLHLYEAARDRLGSDAADTLMELLPLDVSELATKQDLAVQTAEFRAEMSAMRAEMHDEFREQTNRLVLYMVSAVFSSVGLAFVAARF